MAVTHSKKVGCAAKAPGGEQLLDGGVEAREGGGEIGVGDFARRRRRMRSLMRTRCGEVYRPVRRPAARRMLASIAAVEPLPLVPATCTERKARSGCPSALGKHADIFQIEFRGAGLLRRGQFAAQREEVARPIARRS